MTIPVSGPISINTILDEFDAPRKTPLTRMVRGGAYVPPDDFGGPYAGIPTSPPISIDDFRGIVGEVNPIQLDNVLLPALGSGWNAKVIGATNQGVYMDGYAGSGTIPNDAKFVCDLKLSLGPGWIAGQNIGTSSSSGSLFTNITIHANIFVGLTALDPLQNPAAALVQPANVKCGAYYIFYSCDQGYGYGYMIVAAGSDTQLFRDGASSGTTYRDTILPTTSAGICLRVTRGASAPGGKLSFNVSVRNRTDWTTVYQSLTTAGSGASDVYNGDGWFIVANTSTQAYGRPNIKLDTVKLYRGSVTPPW